MDVDNEDDEEFAFSRNYFLAKEVGGSGKKLSKKLMDIDLVDEEDLRAEASRLVSKHEKETTSLLNSYRRLYPKWLFELRCGFGLLMYGFGSKKFLLEDFASTTLIDFGVVVLNGYLQAINIKHAMITIAEVLWNLQKTKRKAPSGKIQPNFTSQSIEELLDFLNASHLKENGCFVYVVVHNIDGPGLSDYESQQYLAQVASCSQVHMIASIDHVNAPLLWDKKMVKTQFNWCWYHVPTFAHYKVEGTFTPLILANSGTSQSAKTAAIVLQSLIPNAQSVFRVLAEYQLGHPEEGLGMSNLYSMCRERFLVSSQVTLNSHLTEFKDHELVRTRRHADGHDCLYIPLSSEALKKLLVEMD